MGASSESKDEPMNNNASPSPGLSQLPSSSSSLQHLPTVPPLPPPTTRNSTVGTPQSQNSGISALSDLSGERSISGIVSGHGTLLRGQQHHIPPPNLLPTSQHYFRPIIPHHQSHLHHRPYTGRAHEDFDLTSDSDASSSIIGPPPPLPLLPGVGRPPSDHHLNPRLSALYNGDPPPIPPNPPGSGKFLLPFISLKFKNWFHVILFKTL